MRERSLSLPATLGPKATLKPVHGPRHPVDGAGNKVSNPGMSSDRFRALPVGRGDCFVFETGGRTIMVDGGQNALGIKALLEKAQISRIDVLVCTHADSDHANGVLGTLLHTAVEIEEVWLPGQWTERLGDLLNAPCDFAHELSRDAERTNHRSLEEYAGSLAVESDETGSDVLRARDVEHQPGGEFIEGDYGDLVQDVLRQEPDPLLLGDGWLWPFEVPHRLFVEGIETARRIRDIALAASDRGIKTRWFDFDEFNRSGPGGGEAYLRPLNSREWMPRRRPRGALEYVALSMANKRSLVFRVPANDQRPDIVFSADSDFGYGRTSNTAPGALFTRTTSGKNPTLAAGTLFTAPHHGSEANAVAYPDISAVADYVLVRSDANYKGRPCPQYRKLAKKYCTICNGGPKRPVELVWDGGWQPQNGTRPCAC